MASFFFSLLWPWLLGTLAVTLLISGIDDFIPVLICLVHRLRHRKAGEREAGTAAGRRIAIFVPCWKESEVIGNMVRHNLAAIRYRNFDFFLGVYPNDEATLAATTQLAEVFHNVHVAECANPGPTSKADCLNWVYRRMLRFEEDHGAYFDTIVLHDAEDMIHPEALALIDRERATYAMVQVPVLPLATKPQEVTHGVYCDEFAEFQTIDMHARQFSGSFVPSNGVGTGFAREILDRLATERGDVFDAESLTEDYEIGVYIHAAGYRQLFAPLQRKEGEFIATREYFPRTARSAIRQRTRWITGIALQCWERRGWRGNWRTRYWFWRDRKGLIANPISLLTNVLFLAGITSWCVAAAQHQPWPLAVQDPALVMLCWLTLMLQCLRTGLRMVCVARIFGMTFALAVPLRAFHGNLINCSATLRALWRYAYNRWHGKTHAWLKTDHAYPAHDALAHHRGELTDVLVSCGFVSQQKLSLALAGLPSGENLAEYLRASGVVSDDDVCKALSLHTGIPSLKVDAHKVKALVARSLPAHLEKRHGILPVRVHCGKLLVAGRNVPSADALEELQSFTSLPIEFQLVTQRNYEELQKLL
ncbi:MAG TPA: glycosyl transferase family protein [Bryobacteraceae bacterium]